MQRKMLETFADWKSHTMDELIRETDACGAQALKIQMGHLRKKLRKINRDILFQDGMGYRMVSLLPPASN